MRVYSRRERALFAILGTLIFLPVAAFTTWMVATMPDARFGTFVFAVLGAWMGTAICLKVAVTGTSTGHLERPAFSTTVKAEPPVSQKDVGGR